MEPEDGPIVPADFDGLHDRATELFDQDPDSKFLVSAAWIRERRQQQTMHRAYGTAIGEVLEARLGPGLRFFVALPTPVEQYDVFTAVGLPEWVLDETPHLSSTVAADRYPVTQSLVRGAVDEILRLSSRALYEPYPGADLGYRRRPRRCREGRGQGPYSVRRHAGGQRDVVGLVRRTEPGGDNTLRAPGGHRIAAARRRRLGARRPLRNPPRAGPRRRNPDAQEAAGDQQPPRRVPANRRHRGVRTRTAAGGLPSCV